MQDRPRFVLREVPLAIYLALAVGAFGKLLYLVAVVAARDPELGRIQAFNRHITWFLLDQAC